MFKLRLRAKITMAMLALETWVTARSRDKLL